MALSNLQHSLQAITRTATPLMQETERSCRDPGAADTHGGLCQHKPQRLRAAASCVEPVPSAANTWTWLLLEVKQTSRYLVETF